MRSLSLVVLAGVAFACGPPSVEVPEGNDKLTSDEPAKDLPAPSLQGTPESYPFRKFVLRGSAPNAARVIVDGAGNPARGEVQPLDGTFCVVVDLATVPANYTLTVRSHTADGKTSAPTQVSVSRAQNAPAPTDAKLCDGSPVDG